MRSSLISYSYRDYPDSARNLRYFLSGTIPYLTNESVIIHYDNEACYPVSEIGHTNVKTVKVSGRYDIEDHASIAKIFDIGGFEHFFFLNSSCVGPILPEYLNQSWWSLLIPMFSESVKLISPVVQIPPDNAGSIFLSEHKYIKVTDKFVPFCHTYFFGLDKVAFSLLIKSGVLGDDLRIPSREDLIFRYERLISSVILNEGYSLQCLMKKHSLTNFRDKRFWNPSLWNDSRETCPEVPGNYYGTDLNPYELMFFKNIRHPHERRSKRSSGISDYLELYLNNILLSGLGNIPGKDLL